MGDKDRVGLQERQVERPLAGDEPRGVTEPEPQAIRLDEPIRPVGLGRPRRTPTTECHIRASLVQRPDEHGDRRVLQGGRPVIQEALDDSADA